MKLTIDSSQFNGFTHYKYPTTPLDMTTVQGLYRHHYNMKNEFEIKTSVYGSFQQRSEHQSIRIFINYLSPDTQETIYTKYCIMLFQPKLATEFRNYLICSVQDVQQIPSIHNIA